MVSGAQCIQLADSVDGDGHKLLNIDLLESQIRFARAVAKFICDHDEFEILPERLQIKPDSFQDIFIIVLFKAKDRALNSQLVKRINATSRIYVSGTEWKDEPATRIAVSNWQVDVKRDLSIVESVLHSVLSSWMEEKENTKPLD